MASFSIADLTPQCLNPLKHTYWDRMVWSMERPALGSSPKALKWHPHPRG